MRSTGDLRLYQEGVGVGVGLIYVKQFALQVNLRDCR
jgi:hypothetical protein